MYRKFKKISIFMLGITVAGLFQVAHADWSVNAVNSSISAMDPQDVVISMKANPRKNTEQACLAVTFARSLSGNPNANVTLFVTLDGVALANKRVINKRRLMCTTPFEEDEITLKENLEAFIGDNQNAMVVCPICWKERYGEEAIPDYGVLPDSKDPSDTDGSDHIVWDKAIGPMIFNAEKILDF